MSAAPPEPSPDRPAEPVTITYLEMHGPPPGAPRPCPPGVEIRRAQPPTVGFYRYLYDAVGRDWHWTDRKKLSDEALARIVQDPAVAVHVLYVDGTPAGYAELDHRQPPEVELVYFGLMPEFIGRGLGAFFLDWAIREAWRHEPSRLWVHTCTRDHPSALGLYERFGFARYKTEVEPG